MSFDEKASPHWLLASLQAAASKAGLAGWSPLTEISAAVATYLHCAGRPTEWDSQMINKLVCRALREVGLREVAANFQIVDPRHTCSLLECALNPPVPSVEGFFQRIRATIDRMHRHGARYLHFTDLTACANALQSAHGSFSGLEPVVSKSRIVAIIRRHVQRLDWPQDIRCLIK